MAADDIPDTLRRTVERLARRLEAGPEPPLPKGLRKAGVLAPLFAASGSLHLLFTVRSGDLASHRGQISFPGGAVEPGETYLEAAYREACEEVGIRGAEGRYLGRLRPVPIQASGFFAVPHVVFFDAPPTLGEVSAEVAAIFRASLEGLLAHRSEEHYERFGVPGSWPVFHLPEGRLWGATAIMVDRLLRLALEDEAG